MPDNDSSVFRKPFLKQEAILKQYSHARTNAIFMYFFSRAYESFTSRLTPVGTGDPRMFRRMPEYLFNVGPFAVFDRDLSGQVIEPPEGPNFHAWLVGGVGGIDEYGYPTSYVAYSANGQNEQGEPDLTEPKEGDKNRVKLSDGEFVLFRPNRLQIPVGRIIIPIIRRMTQTIRSIDNVTGKRGLSLFGTPDSIAESAVNTAATSVEAGDSIKCLKSVDVGTAQIKRLDLFGEAGLPLSDLWESYRHFESLLWETIGENVVSFEKKERLNVPEVESNNERIAHGIYGVARAEMEASLELCRQKWGVDWHLPEPEPETAPAPGPDQTEDPEKTDEGTEGGNEE